MLYAIAWPMEVMEQIFHDSTNGWSVREDTPIEFSASGSSPGFANDHQSHKIPHPSQEWAKQE